MNKSNTIDQNMELCHQWYVVIFWEDPLTGKSTSDGGLVNLPSVFAAAHVIKANVA